MQKPTRTVLALTTGSLVLGLVGAGIAVADEGPTADTPSQAIVVLEPENDQSGTYQDQKYIVGKVVSRGSLTIRSRPSTRSKSVGHLKPGHKVAILCKSHGESIDGNDLWYRLHVKEEKEEHEKQPMNGQEVSDESGNRNSKDGKDGKDGRDGRDGRDGKDGKDGRDGKDSKHGKGGKDGKDNKDGRNGKDGPDSKDGKDGKKAWISARYVKNLDHVKWCD
ncbi:SH3 domain-containing protein [Streptomyces sp. NPDC059355]|uniref:SH3 domain-containing protein n=1 Tax=Streptomyces sp. NPDC059355 TaxID=3346811 RepID=UPI0036BFC95A